jgi:hypothetical protein
MSDTELEPLDSDLKALLDSERLASPPEDALGRVWSRIARGVRPGGGGGKGGGGGGLGSGGGLASHVAAVGVAAFLAGGAVGALAVSAFGVKKRIVYVDSATQRAPVPTVARVTSVFPATRAVESTGVPIPPPPRSPPGLSASPSPSSLSQERSLVDAARAALSSGDATHALLLLDEHARRFARPQLGEEREALAIQALVTQGRFDEARARAARFRATSPGSLFLPAIDASLASIP